MRSPFAERERDRLIAAMLPDVAFDGWTRRALRHAAGRSGIPVEEAMALFPRGAPDLIAAFSHWADRQMLERLEDAPVEAASLPRRVALALRLRFEAMLPWREGVRRGLSVLAMPHNTPLRLLRPSRYAGRPPGFTPSAADRGWRRPALSATRRRQPPRWNPRGRGSLPRRGRR